MTNKTCSTCNIPLSEEYAIMRDDRILCLEYYDKETTPDKKHKKVNNV